MMNETVPSLHHIFDVIDLTRNVSSYLCDGSHNAIQLWKLFRGLSKKIGSSVDNNMEALPLVCHFTPVTTNVKKTYFRKFRASLSSRLKGTKNEQQRKSDSKESKTVTSQRFQFAKEESLWLLLSKVTNIKKICLNCRLDGAMACSITMICDGPIQPEAVNSSIRLPFRTSVSVASKEVATISRLLSCKNTVLSSMRVVNPSWMLEPMDKYESVHTVDLIGNNAICDVNTLENCVSIHTLKLASCNNLTDVSALGTCVSLHTLDLAACDNLKDISALGKCASLHTLSLYWCTLSDVSALGNCESLHTLDISCCQNISDVSELGNCPSLDYINLSGCKSLTDVSRLGSCASLRAFDLHDCINLTDVSGLGKCVSLHTLNISWCTSLRDVSSLGNSTSLHTLDASNCKSLRSVSGLGKCKSLHTLYLSQCENLTDVSGLEFCTSLDTLYLDSCGSLTDVSALGNCESLHTLDLSDTSFSNSNPLTNA